MKFIWSYMRRHRLLVLFIILLKFSGSLAELLLPYVLEHLIDDVAPTGDRTMVLLWGLAMLALAGVVRLLNVAANRRTIRVASDCTYALRRDLFARSLTLSGSQLDAFGLPSLTSRMTSDSYNVQTFIRGMLAVGIRAPVMLLGGLAVTLVMDRGLAMILLILAPVMIVCVVTVSRKGIPLYENVQQRLDTVVRVMRENISGIRVVKALSREPFEQTRFGSANSDMARSEERAGIIMALPGPILTFFLNIGLTLVVLIGARRVNSGVTEPGVILAFLTYFNMILMGVMGLNRIFMLLSKADASAQRIAKVVLAEPDLVPLPAAACRPAPAGSFLCFDHVSFRYGSGSRHGSSFSGRQDSLSDISFTVPKGGSLGIIGATGSGKTTIVNLLMRFYDPQQGCVYVDGQDVRTYEPDVLRRKFGTVFQNDVVFADTIQENIQFGRDISPEQLAAAAEDAHAADFIARTPDGLAHVAAVRGSDFSGGQRQRLLITRALAAGPEILMLDDASSALDYRTDAGLRKAIGAHYQGCTCVVIAQRVSSIMQLDQILVLAEGQIIGKGTHRELLESCPTYREIARVQLGEVS